MATAAFDAAEQLAKTGCFLWSHVLLLQARISVVGAGGNEQQRQRLAEVLGRMALREQDRRALFEAGTT